MSSNIWNRRDVLIAGGSLIAGYVGARLLDPKRNKPEAPSEDLLYKIKENTRRTINGEATLEDSLDILQTLVEAGDSYRTLFDIHPEVHKLLYAHVANVYGKVHEVPTDFTSIAERSSVHTWESMKNLSILLYNQNKPDDYYQQGLFGLTFLNSMNRMAVAINGGNLVVNRKVLQGNTFRSNYPDSYKNVIEAEIDTYSHELVHVDGGTHDLTDIMFHPLTYNSFTGEFETGIAVEYVQSGGLYTKAIYPDGNEAGHFHQLNEIVTSRLAKTVSATIWGRDRVFISPEQQEFENIISNILYGSLHIQDENEMREIYKSPFAIGIVINRLANNLDISEQEAYTRLLGIDAILSLPTTTVDANSRAVTVRTISDILTLGPDGSAKIIEYLNPIMQSVSK